MFLLNRPYRRTQLSVAALFCFLGFQSATWASRLPALKEALQLNAAEIGVLLLSCGLGAAASFPLVAFLMARLGSRRLLYGSSVALGLALLALAGVSSYPAGIFIMFCDGVACACLNAAMNAQGAALEAESRQTTMSRLHAVFSFGALLAALFSSAVLFFTPSLAVHFGLAALVLLSLVLFARPALLRHDLPPEKKKAGKRLALPDQVILWLGFAVFFGTVIEGAMNDWSALYMREVVGAAAEVAPMGIAVVSIMMVTARLFADDWRGRWGDRRIVVWGGLLAAAGLSLALLLQGVAPTLLGFACVGLGIAAVTPCIYVAAAKHGPTGLTMVAGMGVSGLLAGPPVIGFVSEASSLVWGMSAVALAALLLSICAARVRWPAGADEVAPTPPGGGEDGCKQSA